MRVLILRFFRLFPLLIALGIPVWAQSCPVSVTPSSFALVANGGAGQQLDTIANGGSGTISVSAPMPNCSWQAISFSPWITIDNGGSGSGNGFLIYSVGVNTGAMRTGTLTVNGSIVTVAQAGLADSRITDNSVFVANLYRDILGREPDATGLSFWLGHLIAGDMTRTQVAYNFFMSSEFQARGFFLIASYIGVLGRDPDFAGWQYYRNAMAQGLTQLQVVQQLAQFTEFRLIYSSLDNMGFVQRSYQNIFGKDPDPMWVMNYTNQLNSGAMNQAQVLLAMLTSTDYMNKVSNRALATLLYLGFLRRSTDPNGMAFWWNELNTGVTPQVVLNGFITSPEYVGRF